MEPPDEWDGTFSNTGPFGAYAKMLFPEITWQRRFAMIPHKSEVSGKLIWLRYARQKMEGTICTFIWVTEAEYLIERLKGEA